MMTMPPMQDTGTEAPKKVIDLADLWEQISLAKELVRDAEQRVKEHRRIVVENGEMVRRARRAREEAKARMDAMSRTRMVRSAR